MNTQQSLARFRSIAELWSEGQRFRLTTWVALRCESGWVLRFGLTGFSPRAIEGIPVEMKTDHVWAGRRFDRLTKIEAADALKEQLDRPETAILGRSPLSLALPDAAYEINAYYSSTGLERFQGSERFPALQISVSQQPHPHFLGNAEIDLELKSHTIPYQGLADLLSELAIPLDENGLIFQPKAEIVISPPVTFRPTSTLNGGLLKVDIDCLPGVSRSDVRIGVKAFRADGSISRFSLGGGELAWQDDKDSAVASLESEENDTHLALLHLSYQGAFCSQWIAQDERYPANSRLRIHKALDEDETFKTRFFKERPDAFEDQVALLLELLGFTTFKYGGTVGLSNAPDIMATSSEGHVFVIECTTGDINRQGKLHKLHTRTKRISANLAATASAPKGVVPLMVTNAARADTAAHWDTAAGYKIGVICREDLILLLDRLAVPPTPEAFHRAALASIPSKRKNEKNDEPDLFSS